MNPTRVARVWPIKTAEDVSRAIQFATGNGLSVSVAGARHAAGGQQFGTGTLLLDTREWVPRSRFDGEVGTIEVSGGTEWPQLMAFYLSAQKGKGRQWGIAQKQGGLDGLTMGGTLSANAHGHTLTLPPIVHDVESFELVDASGKARQCSRQTNPELFRLAIGGYGLFGVISKVKLRLIPRRKLRRNVGWARVEDVVETLDRRVANGSLYGDFQYCTDEASPDFMERGILTTYDPADTVSSADDLPREPSSSDLEEMLYLAHVNRAEAFRRYADASLGSSGEIVWSDTHQYSPYPRWYHHRIDKRLGARSPGCDPLTEVYVPRNRLAEFFVESRREMLRRRAVLIYGTVRLIKRDGETSLPWARDDYSCVIFTVHTDRTPDGTARTSDLFCTLISMATEKGGSYYLTYNRFATAQQLENAHPNFRNVLQLKKKYDPQEIFQSDWYRYYRDEFK